MAEALRRQESLPGFPLDRRAFFDDVVLDREFRQVFKESWQLLGFASELPDPGDYLVRRLGNDSVIVARDEQGGFSVLLNSCSHRGTQLCRATFGNAAHFRCSYHGWTFANDGRLVGVPSIRSNYPKDFRKQDHDLPRARVTCYRGFIFATWSDQAPPLEEHLGDFRWYLDAMLDLAGGEWEVYGPPQRSVMKGNWKVVTDNFAGDGYHMGTTHQAAFEQGIYGDSLADGTLGKGELELIGINIGTPQGHAVRAGYVVQKGRRTLPSTVTDPAYIGYPREVWEQFTAAQTPEQVRFNSHCEVVHGVVFPNAAFLSVSHDRAIGRENDPLTKYVVWRVHNPIDARRTECTYWTLVPRQLDEDWKRRSYAFQARSQSAGGILFEMDDFENFARIDAAISGTVADTAPLDLSLGLGLGTPVPDFPGPGRAEYLTLSEHNQRAFYRRWAELMEEGTRD
ncbi:Rieske 2Fe-2S domain-containing protein [Kitasatospora sp. GP82]|uniref:aromatic ring-hydroxylating oxygenase subunit alpha n=1 Tax=Kitasatospora sp. GP82 TaxID=3035089 RepID=UPI0024748EE6|nr:Rieske 2Fe-2S domain-containing protein [Kitasatospora sp. GP82]MDH6128346.1 phenylpropionate dioxygenase-like ring-hydroxylating dioxygenase large terminal subunit [Kitasatospora sp. GP82]